MEIVADSHALFWWLSPALHGKLSRRARETFEQAERISVPTVVLLELLSLFERHGEGKKFTLLLSRLTTPRYQIVPLSLAIVRRCAQLPGTLELHDRVIVASAQELAISLVSKDRAIRRAFPRTVW